MICIFLAAYRQAHKMGGERARRKLNVLVVLIIIIVSSGHSNSAQECNTIEDPLGTQYMGKVNVTWSGIECQRWDSQTPHEPHQDAINGLPDDSVQAAENYCRNPDKAGRGIWCYTVDENKRYDFCHVPECDCRSVNDPYGAEYMGTMSTTPTGRTCQRWDSQIPHEHSFSASGMPDDETEEAENFCRNPDHHPRGLWCYTTDSDPSYEFCEVKTCECSAYFDSPSKSFSSPGYPSPYPGNLDCRWNIVVQYGKVVALDFEDLKLTSTVNCKLDSVTIYDGNSTSDPVLEKFCGEDLPPKTYSTGNSMLVVFRSDPSDSKAGFEATYVTRSSRNLTELRLEAREKQKNAWERQTRDELMRDYSAEIPSLAESPVSLAYTLTKIIDVNEKSEELSLAVYLTLWWGDERLIYERPVQDDSVNGSSGKSELAYEHGDLIFKLTDIWYPNVVHYNNVGDRSAELIDKDRNAITYGDGKLYWSKNVIVTSPCDMDVTYFPLDNQVCDVMFSVEPQGPVKITGNIKARANLSAYYPDSAWSIDRQKDIQRINNEGYLAVTFRQTLHRKYQYYIFRVMAPVSILSILVMCVFFIPPDAGEKISLGVTLLLTFSVFQMIVDEDLPASSTSTPLITRTMVILQVCSSMSIMGSVLILHIHHISSGRGKKVPRWLRLIFFHGLAKLTGHNGDVKRITRNSAPGKVSVYNQETGNAKSSTTKFETGNAKSSTTKFTSVTSQAVSVETSAAVMGNNLLLAEMKDLLEEIKESVTKVDEDAENEWKLLAQILDRVLMYICLITMCGVYTGLFVQLPQQESG